ncbi:unnamed protein product [Leptosia nina]|uniref:Uncharacterized protein n=1 Tax=Leptosia nina TaxID=320188 RepID=A0AAV1JD13_9NEOP
MLTIAFFIGVLVICYVIKTLINQQVELQKDMAEQEKEQVRCSSSESDNFEKIDSEEVRAESNDENPHFVMGDETPSSDEGPANEGGDFFPNAPPPNIRRVLTPAQQLALAERRSKLR